MGLDLPPNPLKVFPFDGINPPPRFGSRVDGHVCHDAGECSLRLHVLSGDHEEKSAELCLAGTLHVGKGRLLIGGFTCFNIVLNYFCERGSIYPNYY